MISVSPIFCHFRIRSDHNIDNSTSKVKEWLNGTEHMYNYVDFVFDDAERGTIY